MKKFLLTLALTVTMIMGLQMCAFANGECTCPMDGKWPHDNIGHAQYTYNADIIEGAATATQHRGFCDSCMNNGHWPDCEQVLGPWENHTFQFEGSGADRKKVCAKCGYKIDAPCTHSNLAWEWAGDDKCAQKCKDCGLTVQTAAHDFKPYNYQNKPEVASFLYEKSHGMCCERCGHFDTFDKPHNFKNTYKSYKLKKNPIIDIADKTSASLYHKVTYTCKDCGYSYVSSSFSNPDIKHVFKKNKCKYCGFKRTILPKASGVKAVQQGPVSKNTYKVAAHWEWVGNELYWRKAYTYDTYSFKVNMTWNKVAKAYGYVVSTTKIKQGDYVNKVGKGYSHTFTKKNSYTYAASINDRKTTRVTLYVAPVSKESYIGKVQKVVINVK